MKRGREHGRPSVVLQHRTVWQGSALLLKRPDERFPARLAEGNIAAAREAYGIVRAQRKESVDA